MLQMIICKQITKGHITQNLVCALADHFSIVFWCQWQCNQRIIEATNGIEMIQQNSHDGFKFSLSFTNANSSLIIEKVYSYIHYQWRF